MTLEALHPEWLTGDGEFAGRAIGLRFDCPSCAVNRGVEESSGICSHRLAIYWGAPDAQRNKWTVVHAGEFADLSIYPTIEASAHPDCLGWHGIIEKGQVIDFARR